MGNSTYLQRVRTFVQRGVRIGGVSALLINLAFALIISFVINVTEPSWDFTLRDSVFLTLLATSIFMLVVFIGIALIGLGLALWKLRLSNTLAALLSLIVATISSIAANYMFWTLFFAQSFRNFETFVGQFLPLFIVPDVSNILVLLYVGQKMNGPKQLKESLTV